MPIHVPQRLIHGVEDDTVPIELSERYANAARKAGDDADLSSLPGTGHFELIDPRSRQWRTVVEAVKRLLK